MKSKIEKEQVEAMLGCERSDNERVTEADIVANRAALTPIGPFRICSPWQVKVK